VGTAVTCLVRGEDSVTGTALGILELRVDGHVLDRDSLGPCNVLAYARATRTRRAHDRNGGILADHGVGIGSTAGHCVACDLPDRTVRQVYRTTTRTDRRANGHVIVSGSVALSAPHCHVTGVVEGRPLVHGGRGVGRVKGQPTVELTTPTSSIVGQDSDGTEG